MSSPRLYLNHDADCDWLLSLEFGRVDEGQTDDAWVGVSDAFGYLTDPPGGPVVGFAIKGSRSSIPRRRMSVRSGLLRTSMRRCSD